VSSLRLDSLRLCWLETFVTVVQEANISEAARELDINQSTASRNIQALEKWVGKKLIEPGKITDPENPGVSVGLTDDGQAFYDLSLNLLDQLNAARAETAVRQWLIDDCTKMLRVMRHGLKMLRNPDKWQRFTQSVAEFESNLYSVSTIENIGGLRSFHTIVRVYFRRYEREIRKETKPVKKATPPPSVSDEWFDAQRARRQPT